MSAPSDTLSFFSQAKLHADGSITFDLFTAPLTLTFGVGGPNVLTLTQSLGGGNRGVIDFAPGLAGKEASAGRIGYMDSSNNSLDIVGAGATGGSRQVKVWDTLVVGDPSYGAGLPGAIVSQGILAGFQGLSRNNDGGGFVLYGPATQDIRFFMVGSGDVFRIKQTPAQAGVAKSTIMTAPGSVGGSGEIGYEAYTVGALDIVGVGVAPARHVKIWEALLIQPSNPGSVAGGSLYIDSTSGNLLYVTPALTVRTLALGP